MKKKRERRKPLSGTTPWLARVRRYFSRRPEVLSVYLFGSRASGRATPRSDTDIAVLIKPSGRRSDFDRQLSYSHDLERILNSEVDVAVLNHADPFLTQQVFTKGKSILVRNRKGAEELKWRLIRGYWDFIPIKRIMDDTAIARLQRGH